MNKTDVEFTVIGGGFSGLVTAYFLCRKGKVVHLVEASDRLGGLLGTHYTEYGLVETAANAFISTPRVEQLFADLGINICKANRESSKRFIFRGKPKRWPLGFFESLIFLKNLIFFILRFSKNLPKKHQSVSDWVESKFGAPVHKYFVGPALRGIYAGDSERLSASLILGPLFSKKNSKSGKYKGSLSAPKGMQQIIDALVTEITHRGTLISLKTPIEKLGDCRHPHIVCTNMSRAGHLIGNEALCNMESIGLVTVTQFFRPSDDDVKGFGVLFPKDQQFSSSGVLFNNHIFPYRSEFRSETWILAEKSKGSLCAHSESAILRLVREDRERLYGSHQPPLYYKITKWPEAIPYYDKYLEQELEKLKLPHNVYLCGNYLGGIGLSKILERSYNLVESLT